MACAERLLVLSLLVLLMVPNLHDAAVVNDVDLSISWRVFHVNNDFPHVPSKYVISATIARRPPLPSAAMALYTLSFVVKRSDLSDGVSKATIECLTDASSTKVRDWGLFKAHRFASDMIQAEYFAVVDLEKAFAFRSRLADYQKKRQLGGCVRGKVIDFSPRSDVVAGRRITKVQPERTDYDAIRRPGWVAALLVCLVLCCVALSVALCVLKKRRYSWHTAEEEQDQVFLFQKRGSAEKQVRFRFH